MENCPNIRDISAAILDSLELTGRAATHVHEIPDLGCRVQPQVGTALLALRDAAREAGIRLKIVSGFRDFNRQLALWRAKFNGERPVLDRAGEPVNHAELYDFALIQAILTWSALPGASRHHWGTDVDVIDAAAVPDGYRPQLTAHEFAPGGCFECLGGWLDSNMERFGFFRPYAADRGGVQPEPWHLSYAPLSVRALEMLSLDVLREAIEGADMPGRDTVLERLPELYERYVLRVERP